ncbi:MAG: DUF4097 family beta strand repeat protein [Clostridia bacterium]|nr:DUF4097 family beta strand repeat protein [Clostridia bacterium]
MKKSVWISMIVAGACLLCGVVIATIGFALGGFELSAIESEPLVTNEYILEEEFSRIAIDVSAADVCLEPSTDGACHVVCTDRERIEYEVAVIEGTLTVRFADTGKWYEHIVSVSTASPSVTVYLPGDTYRSLTVNTSSGGVAVGARYTFEEDVKLTASSGTVSLAAAVGGSADMQTSSGDIHLASKSLYALTATTSSGRIRVESGSVSGAVKLTTSSGDVEWRNTACGALTVTTSSGDVTVDGLTVTDTARVTVTSGRISLTRTACGELYAQSSSGRVELTDLIASGHLRTQTTSGDVRLTRSDAATLDIQTSSGSVTGSLLTAKIIYTDTSSGSVSVPKSTEGGLCEITTSSGDIRITYIE